MVKKSLFVLSVCSNPFFGFSFSVISKTEQTTTLHFFVKIPFCNFCWQKPRASLLKIVCSSWFTPFSHFSLTVLRSVVAMTRTSAAGHPLQQAVPFLFLFLLLFLLSLISLFCYDSVFFFFLSSLFLFCNSCVDIKGLVMSTRILCCIREPRG